MMRSARHVGFQGEAVSPATVAAGPTGCTGIGGKTVETRVLSIVTELGMKPELEHHRRVPAVLACLRA